MIDECRLMIFDVSQCAPSSAKSEINNHQSAFINPFAPGGGIDEG